MRAASESKQARQRVGRYQTGEAGVGLTLDGAPVELSWRCQEAFAALLEAGGDVVKRDALFGRLWPGVTVEDSSLTKVVSELRRTLAAGDSEREYIETVPGIGYRLAAPVEPVSPPPSPRGSPRRWAAVGALGAVAVLALVAFEASPRQPGPAAPSPADAAYEQGMELLNKQSWKPRQDSIQHFQQAIELDPAHARSHAALAFALMGAKGKDASLAAARKAVELDPGCGPCQAMLGYALEVLEWDWEGSRTHLARAVELDPADSRSRRWYAHNLAINGELELALAEAEHAIRIAPYESGTHINKAVALYLLERYEESVSAADDAIGLEYKSTGAWEFRSKALFQLGRHKEAMGDIFRQWQPWQPWLVPTMSRLEQDGWRAALDEFLHAPNSSYRIGNNPYHRAWWFTLLDRPEEALTELEACLELRPYNMVYTAVDPGFRPLHGRPRFEAILKALGRDGARFSLSQQFERP